MRVAFAIFKYFPHGGVARDLRKIAAECLARGHAARIYAMTWQGAPLQGAEIVILPTRGFRGHVRQRRFAAAVARHLGAHPVDLVVGMNKMPGLDVYYAGDSCFVAKARTQRPRIYRLTPRYRHFAAFEHRIFAAEGRARVLSISPPQAELYASIYDTPGHRFHPLPPGLERDRAGATAEAADAVRRELDVGAQELLLLFVGSGFVKKGLDRALRGVAALPRELRARTRFCIAGADRAARFRRLARRLGVGRHVRFLGGREDVPALLRAADGLVLPAYDENTGTVILESAIAGLPVLITANCGYARYVTEHCTGIVTAAPFDQLRFNADLERLLTSPERRCWTERGRALGRNEELYAMPQRATELLETFASASERPLVALCAFEYSRASPRYRALPAIVAACRERGVEVRVYAGASAEAPPDMPLVRLRTSARSAAGRLARYRQALAHSLRCHRPRCVVGFDEAFAGVDVRCGSALAVVCRQPAPATAPRAEVPLPPGVSPAPPAGTPKRPADDPIVFAMAGGDLVAHGIDRLFAAFGKLPATERGRCRVLAAGKVGTKHLAAARAFGMADRVTVHADPREVLTAADVFVELSFQATSNGWIFDAMAHGAAVLTHADVAEARLVREADAGVVLEAPFRQADCDRALQRMVAAAAVRRAWQGSALRWARHPARYGQAEQVAEQIADWLAHSHQSGKADAPPPA